MGDYFPDGRVTENIYHCSDGKYRWIYEFSMMKNPVILFTIFKVLGIGFLVVFAIVMITTLANGNIPFQNFKWEDNIFAIIMLLIFVGIVFLSYFIVAAQYGFKYCVIFEMDDNGIEHIQQDQQFNKAQGMAFFQMTFGAVTGSINNFAGGLMRYDKQSQYTQFSLVYHAKVMRAFHTIKLDAPFSHNQIYADRNDIDFVLNFIRAHVPPKVAGKIR